MSNISRELTVLKCVRNIGSKNFNTNEIFAGTYFPAHVNSKGAQISARWEGNFAINHHGYPDSNGNLQGVPSDIISITAWNGKTPRPRGGQADTFARGVSIGMEISLDVQLKTYKGEFWSNNGVVGGPVMRINMPNGQPYMIDKMGFTVVPNSLILGQEADNLIREEVMVFMTTGGAKGRPRFWNDKSHTDFQIFRQMCQMKNSTMYQPGADRFGYSMVKVMGVPGNAYANQQPLPTQPVNAAPVNPLSLINPGMVAAATAPVLVEGHPIEAYRKAGVTDEIMLSNVNFAAFHPQIMNARLLASMATGNTATSSYPPIANNPFPVPGPVNNMMNGNTVF